jgi:hypothetical protein
MHLVSSLVVGLSVLSSAVATGTVQLEFKRNEELARRSIQKRQSNSNGISTTLQLFNTKLYFIEVAVSNLIWTGFEILFVSPSHMKEPTRLR